MPVIATPEAWAGLPVTGIFVGGCIDGRKSFRRRAHAHNEKGSQYPGWICVRSEKRLYTSSGTLSRTMWHELAHILTPGHGHDDAWRAMMRKLGQPIPKHLQKKTHGQRAGERP
jgi:hypothetical protein